MHKSLVIAAACLLAASAFLPVALADQAAPPKPAATRANMGPANPYAAQFKMMSSNLQLSPEQTAKIKEFTDNMLNQMEEFRAAANKKIHDDHAAAYARSGDERTTLLHQLREYVLKARADYEKIASDFQAKINTELKPEQRLSWEMVKLDHVLSPHLANVQFSDDQGKQVAALLEAAAKELAATPDGITASSPITGKLLKKLCAEILTEEQTAQFLLAPNNQPIVVPQGIMGGGIAATRPAKAAKPPKDPGLP